MLHERRVGAQVQLLPNPPPVRIDGLRRNVHRVGDFDGRVALAGLFEYLKLA